MQDPHLLQVPVFLLLAVLVLSRLADRLRIAAPVLLLLGGVPVQRGLDAAEIRLERDEGAPGVTAGLPPRVRTSRGC